MQKSRHQIERISPTNHVGIEQQFWPVLIAVVVLCSMGAGAIVTLTHGPWMWGSLLFLPAIGAGSVFALYCLENRWLRRSLQTAILLSFAVHLLVVVVASVTSIFGKRIPEQPIEITKTPQKKIEVTNRLNEFVFQKAAKHEVENRELLPEKSQSTSSIKPFDADVKSEEMPLHSSLTRRREQQQNISRQSRHASVRSRSKNLVQPTAKPKNQAFASKTESKRGEVKLATSNTLLLKKVDADHSSRLSQKSDRMPEARVKRQFDTDALAAKRESSAITITQSSERTAARIRREDPAIPRLAIKTEPQFSNSTPVKKRSEPTRIEPSNDARIEKILVESVNLERTKKSNLDLPLNHTARSTGEKRRTTETSNLPEKRLSNLVAKQNVAAPVVPDIKMPETARSTARPKSKKSHRLSKRMAISKSNAGRSGTGRSENLNRFSGSQASPIKRASDSSNRRRMNRASENISLNSVRKSQQVARSFDFDTKRILKSEKLELGKFKGAKVPDFQAKESAAANIDSATVKSNALKAVDKGTSVVDFGPTKFMPEVVDDRRGGGGQVEINRNVSDSTVNTESVGRCQSRRQANLKPTSTTVFDLRNKSTSEKVASPMNLNSNSIRIDKPRNPGASFANLKTNDSPTTEPLLNENATVARRRTSHQGPMSESWSGRISRSQIDGNSQSKIGRAPLIENEVVMGMSGREVQTNETTSESKQTNQNTKMDRRTEQLAGAGTLLRSASNLIASSATSMPLFGDHKPVRKRNTSEEFNGSSNGVSEFRGPAKTSQQTVEPRVANQLEIGVEKAQSIGGNELAKIGSSRLAPNTSVSRTESGDQTRRSHTLLDVEAEDGTGGLGMKWSRDFGKRSNDIRDLEVVNFDNNVRFKRVEFGGKPSPSQTVSRAKKAFQSRNPGALVESGPKTEAAIELGLEFLSRCQLTDGSWTLGQFDSQDPLHQNLLTSDTAATGLALLAFQGAGYNHLEFKYASQLKAAVEWMAAKQAKDGCLYLESDKKSNSACRMYSHAIATLALAEAFGMTQDPDLARTAQKAIDYIVATQDRRKGGWRYFAEPNLRSSDTSVTGWMVMALKSGELAGLEVPESSFARIEDWLSVALAPNTAGQFRYNPYAVDSAGVSRSHGRKASTTMTSVGLLMSVYSGWAPDDSRFQAGAKTLLVQLPSEKDSRSRDTYFWYYATQVLKHAGGDLWEQWRSKLHPLLVETQEQTGPMSGSWHPFKPVPDRWAPQGGRIYVTTMNLLSLEVKYRLLPLYEKTIK